MVSFLFSIKKVLNLTANLNEFYQIPKYDMKIHLWFPLTTTINYFTEEMSMQKKFAAPTWPDQIFPADTAD